MAVNLSPFGGAGWQFFNNNGVPLAGGKIYTYAAGTTSPQTTYTTNSGVTANSNPIVLNSAGRVPSSGEIWLTVGASYKFVLKDSSDVLIATYDNISNLFNTDSFLVSYQPAGAGAVATTVQAKLRQNVSVKDFGAVGNNVVDDTAAIQLALTAAAGKSVYIPAGTYKTSSALTIPSQTVVYGDGPGSVISCTNSAVSQFIINGGTKCQVRDLSINVTTTGTAAYVAGIEIKNSSTFCIVQRVSFSGLSWGGVWINQSDKCQVSECNFSNWVGTVQDSSDVCVYQNCSNTIVSNNQMNGGGAHGVLIQDPYSGFYPNRTLVIGNRIGQHTTYGVAVYLPTGPVDTFNEIIGNFIENIQGSFSSNRSSGAGIYIAGLGTGGTVVSNNIINNCCVQTLDRNLTPAAIGINGTPSTVTPCAVTGNSISGMTQGDGINISSSAGGATISNNSITIPSTNNGSGSGGSGLIGNCININASSNVSISNGLNANNGSGNALFVYANGANISNISVSGGGYSTSGSGSSVRITTDAAYTTGNLNMIGVRSTVSNSSANAFQLNYISNGVLSGLIATANGGAGVALSLSSSTGVRISGGYYIGAATTNISTAGTSTNSFIDKTVYFGATFSLMSNAGSGCNVDTRGTSAPGDGNWQVGDQVTQRTPVVGSPKGWFCTVAGAPGTWVSQGNL
jgi:hypothetical protein